MNYYYYMAEAIKEAHIAAANGDVPVGAVAVCNGEIIGRGHNCKEQAKDPLSHAEIEAIKAAVAHQNGWRLSDVTLFVTMEPCPMCAGAILQARIPQLVFGAWDLNWGACGSRTNLFSQGFPHRVEVIGGIKETECAALTENFFRQRRKEPL